MSDKNKCLYFDDEINLPSQPLDTTIITLERKYALEIDRFDQLKDTEDALKQGGYKLVFIDIRIEAKNGGGIDNRNWRRTGIALINRIREGWYEPESKRDIPIIVITAVADTEAQREIISIGKGENEYRISLFEKPANDDKIGEVAKGFLKLL